MAQKRPTDFEIEISNAMKNWTYVNREQDPIEWQAWVSFRRDVLGSSLECDNLTVPTPFPPTTQQAIDAYVEVIRTIRRINGTATSRRRGSSQVIQFPAR